VAVLFLFWGGRMVWKRCGTPDAEKDNKRVLGKGYVEDPLGSNGKIYIAKQDLRIPITPKNHYFSVKLCTVTN